MGESIEIYVLVGSEINESKTLSLYKNANQLYSDNDYLSGNDFNHMKKNKYDTNSNRRLVHLIDIHPKTDEYNKLIIAIYNKDREAIVNTLQSVDQFYLDSMLAIEVPKSFNIDDENTILQIFPKTKKRYHDVVGDVKKSYVTKNTLLKRYVLNGEAREIPYSNYDLNNGQGYCVYNYVKSQYGKRIGKKILDKFDKKDVTIEEIINFCLSKKIKCILYNMNGSIIYSNDLNKSRNYNDFIGIVSCNHLYPLKKECKIHKPQLNNEAVEKRNENSIFLSKNKNCYTSDGVEKITDVNLDNEFFKGIFPNFTYESEKSIQFKPLLYSHPEMREKLFFELDLNKAYYTVSNQIKDNECFPIFTVSCRYEKYLMDAILPINYYLLSKNALKKLKHYGINTNSQAGYLILFFIEIGEISKNDIEYVKVPKYVCLWGKVKSRISNLDKDQNFCLYNGTLGKLYNHRERIIGNVYSNEDILLNVKHDDWKLYYDNNNESAFRRINSEFRYINTVNIYNFVVSQTSLFLLQAYIAIRKNNKNSLLVKIRTDSLGFDRVVSVPKEFKSFFKALCIENKIHDSELKYKTDENGIVIKPNLSCNNYSQVYHDGKIIIDNVNNELDIFKQNVSYHGPPGTGKTHNVMHEEKYDICATTTNICSINISNELIKGKTIYSLLNLHTPDLIYKKIKRFANKTIWIDEFTMVNQYIWNYFYLMAKTQNVKFIFSGDINQIPPVNECKIDLNNFFFNAIMGNKKILNVDHRNDEGIITLRNNVLNLNGQALEKYMERFISNDDFTQYKRHICFTHACRLIINKKIMEQSGLVFKKGERSVGVILTPKVKRKKLGLHKNDCWKIIARNGDIYKLKNINNGITIDIDENDMKYFSVGFAITAHSAQGLTINEVFCIHEISKMIKNDKSILYTAVTRGTKFNNLRLYMNKPQGEMLIEENDEISEEDDIVQFDNVRYIM